MTAVLVDDDKLNNDLLIQLLGKYCPEVKVVGTAQNLDQAIEVIVAEQPDLLFLDIELHNRNANELLKAIHVEKMQVIIISAHSKYSLEMYKYSVVDYLLKPLLITDLTSAVNKAFRNFEKHNEHDLANIQLALERYIALPEKDHLNIVKMNEIVRLEASNNYTKILTSDNRSIISSRALKEYEEILPRQIFIRVHNSHMVNLQYVSKYLRTKNGCLILQDGSEIPISANRKKEVTDRIVF